MWIFFNKTSYIFFQVTRNLIETIPISLNLEITQNDLAKAVIWHEVCISLYIISIRGILKKSEIF